PLVDDAVAVLVDRVAAGLGRAGIDVRAGVIAVVAPAVSVAVTVVPGGAPRARQERLEVGPARRDLVAHRRDRLVMHGDGEWAVAVTRDGWRDLGRPVVDPA